MGTASLFQRRLINDLLSQQVLQWEDFLDSILLSVDWEEGDFALFTCERRGDQWRLRPPLRRSLLSFPDDDFEDSQRSEEERSCDKSVRNDGVEVPSIFFRVWLRNDLLTSFSTISIIGTKNIVLYRTDLTIYSTVNSDCMRRANWIPQVSIVTQRGGQVGSHATCPRQISVVHVCSRWTVVHCRLFVRATCVFCSKSGNPCDTTTNRSCIAGIGV